MKTTEHIREFLDPFVAWASEQADVEAIALVGSYARGEARDDSDVDLVILTDQPETYLDDVKWIERFGAIEKQQVEEYGKLRSLRVWYQDGREVEYGLTVPALPKRTLLLVQLCIQREYLVDAIFAKGWAVAMVIESDATWGIDFPCVWCCLQRL